MLVDDEIDAVKHYMKNGVVMTQSAHIVVLPLLTYKNITHSSICDK
jgi:hypothetical protein